MAKRPARRQQQQRPRSLLRRLTRGPTLLAAAAMGAVVVVAVVIVVSVLTQGGDGIQRIDDIEVRGRTRGVADAPVTIIEFADYQCPHCKSYAQTIAEQIEEEYVANNLVRVEFHNMAFLGNESVWAAMAAECANDQEKFWEYHDMLFEKQRGENRGAFSIERLKRFAGDLGLDQADFDECLDSGRHAQLVQDETEAARDAGVDSTPTLFILVTGSDDYEKVGPRDFDDVRDPVEMKLEEAQATP